MRHRFLSHIASVLAVVVLLAITTVAVSADPRDFTLWNSTGSTIYYVYVSPSGVSGWEEDLLGSDVVLAGDSLKITFSSFRPGRCFYDIKVVTSDDREGYLWGVDLCSTTNVTFH